MWNCERLKVLKLLRGRKGSEEVGYLSPLFLPQLFHQKNSLCVASLPAHTRQRARSWRPDDFQERRMLLEQDPTTELIPKYINQCRYRFFAISSPPLRYVDANGSAKITETKVVKCGRGEGWGRAGLRKGGACVDRMKSNGRESRVYCGNL